MKEYEDDIKTQERANKAKARKEKKRKKAVKSSYEIDNFRKTLEASSASFGELVSKRQQNTGFAKSVQSFNATIPAKS